MTSLSTHDTKRGEDVRARISVFSELATEWAEAVRRWNRLAPLPDGPLANLMWQAIVGAWPIDRDRLHAYAEKAAREAGNSTAWIDSDAEFETQLHALVDAAFDVPELHRSITDMVGVLTAPGRSNSLSAKLVQLLGPGVPDVYQGTELWENSLVDPTTVARWMPRSPTDCSAGSTAAGGPGWTTPALPSCWWSAPRCGCGGTARSCSPATPRCPRPGRRQTTWWPSTAAV